MRATELKIRYPTGASSRIRLGLYMHAPRIGGAETYFRDLAHAMDPEIFEVHAIIPPWTVFASFLDLEKTPERALAHGKRG